MATERAFRKTSSTLLFLLSIIYFHLCARAHPDLFACSNALPAGTISGGRRRRPRRRGDTQLPLRISPCQATCASSYVRWVDVVQGGGKGKGADRFFPLDLETLINLRSPASTRHPETYAPSRIPSHTCHTRTVCKLYTLHPTL